MATTEEFPSLSNVRISTSTLNATFNVNEAIKVLEVIDISPMVVTYVKNNNTPIKVVNSCYSNGSVAGYESYVKLSPKKKKKTNPEKKERKQTGNGTTIASSIELILFMDSGSKVNVQLYHKKGKISLIGPASRNEKINTLSHVTGMFNNLFTPAIPFVPNVVGFILVNFAFKINMNNTTDIINLKNISYYILYKKSPECGKPWPILDSCTFIPLENYDIVDVNTNITRNKTHFIIRKKGTEKKIRFTIWQSGKVNVSGNNKEHILELIKFINDSVEANYCHFISETLAVDDPDDPDSESDSESDNEGGM